MVNHPKKIKLNDTSDMLPIALCSNVHNMKYQVKITSSSESTRLPKSSCGTLKEIVMYPIIFFLMSLSLSYMGLMEEISCVGNDRILKPENLEILFGQKPSFFSWEIETKQNFVSPERLATPGFSRLMDY